MNKKFEKRRRSSENSHTRNKEDFFVILKTNMHKRDFCLARKLIGRKISLTVAALTKSAGMRIF